MEFIKGKNDLPQPAHLDPEPTEEEERCWRLLWSFIFLPCFCQCHWSGSEELNTRRNPGAPWHNYMRREGIPEMSNSNFLLTFPYVIRSLQSPAPGGKQRAYAAVH